MSILRFINKINYYSPSGIAIVCGLLSIIINASIFIYQRTISKHNDPEIYWLMTLALMLFFIIINVVLGFKSNDLGIYYRDSIYSYIGLVASILFITALASGKSIFVMHEFQWLIKLMTIIFIVLLTILSLVKKIVGIALIQEKKMRDENFEQ